MVTPLRHLIWIVAGSVSVFAAKHPPEESRNTPEIVDRYVQACRRQSALQNGPTEVEITATLLKSQLRSQVRALRRVSANGEIAYDILQTSGDGGLRRQVIARYLTAESQSRNTDATALTPANYKFQLKAIVDQPGRRMHVLQVTPRKKKDGLFQGELWLDEATGMPVFESGQLVKAPHPLLKRVTFARDYELRDGMAVPTHTQITIDVRFWGRAALSIGFTQVQGDEKLYESVY